MNDTPPPLDYAPPEPPPRRRKIRLIVTGVFAVIFALVSVFFNTVGKSNDPDGEGSSRCAVLGGIILVGLLFWTLLDLAREADAERAASHGVPPPGETDNKN